MANNPIQSIFGGVADKFGESARSQEIDALN